MLKIPFKIDASSVSETLNEQTKPERVVQHLAMQKAKDISKAHADSIIIGADTIVVLENNILGKPESKQSAVEMLESLSGAVHQVLTGIALLKTDSSAGIVQKKLFYEQTSVAFGKLDSNLIRRYVDTGKPMDKAGAYGIQDRWGAISTERIHGDFYNVMGLPLHALYWQLKSFAPQILIP